MAKRETLRQKIRAVLTPIAEPARAPKMKAYMKSEMPYLGVTSPKLRAALNALYATYPFESAEQWRADALALWRTAEVREERYAAIQLTGHRKAKSFQTLDALPMYEEMIVDGAWWDYVDEIASNRIGPLLAAYPREMTRTMRAWSRSPDMWKRRTSIICQLGFKGSIDVELLYACIAPSIDSKEFFLRKAIGWALRQHARLDPAEVRRYVTMHEAQLSGLSKREALKHVPGDTSVAKGARRSGTARGRAAPRG
jgi:3-methyladenine DNA glycosylase AlkD